MQLGKKIANQEYRPYEGRRIAPLSANEYRAIGLAGESVGVGQKYMDEAAGYGRAGAMSWGDADQATRDKYLNPYIKGALDPAARELREYGQREMSSIGDKAASMDAFGGRRSALAKADVQEKTLQSLSDLYGTGYAQAYESAASMFGQDRARELEAAGRFAQFGKDAQSMAQADISTLLATGAVDRNIEQAARDFDYQQWTEERDWDIRGLSSLVAAIQGTKGSYSTTTTSDSEVERDNTGDIIGGIVSVIGMAMMFSDERLKDNIKFIGTYMGQKIYTWTWKPIARLLGLPLGPCVGVIAQEVDPAHTAIHPSGYMMVNYQSLFGGRHG